MAGNLLPVAHSGFIEESTGSASENTRFVLQSGSLEAP